MYAREFLPRLDGEGVHRREIYPFGYRDILQTVELLGKETLALDISAVFDLYLDLLRHLAVDVVATYKFSELRQRRGQIFDRKFVSGDEII